ncbi:MAG: hypothetical protein AAF366_20235 [Pseudomonadota bacterium]
MRAFIGLPVPEPWIAPLIRAQGAVPGGREGAGHAALIHESATRSEI